MTASGSAPPSDRGAREVVTLAGGCFWCTEAVFSELNGVVTTTPGYSGGKVPNPSYEAVCTGRTGHAESLDVVFDPSVISLNDLLMVFFSTHDPTTRNRQGNDVGTQYRSAIFYRSAAQRKAAEEAVREVEAAGIWRNKVVTEILPCTAFYPAEEYHRSYFRRNPEKAYCQLVIAPKLSKFRHQFANRLRSR